jgi:1,4-dihydroxy-2-naphthoate octaprenyltransferase
MSTLELGSSSRSAWLLAARPRTLALALASIGMGTFLAAADGHLDVAVAVLTFLTAVWLQILSNLANDYGDSVHGADSAGRLGPPRAVQSGQISAASMRRAIMLCAALAAVSGLLLLWLAFGRSAWIYLLLFLLLGGLAVGAAVTYTAGDRPYGYAGLGDLMVFVFFGLVAVVGTYFLQRQQLAFDVFLPAASCGFFAVGVLNVNNIRDLRSDAAAGKRSIPVRIGRQNARFYHWALLIGGLLCAAGYVLLNWHSPWQWLFLLAVPLFLRNGLVVWRTEDPVKLDPMLRQLSLSTLAFVLLFGVGQLL